MFRMNRRISMESNMISVLILLLLLSGDDYLFPLRNSKVFVGAPSPSRRSVRIPEGLSERHHSGPAHHRRYQNGAHKIVSNLLRSLGRSQREDGDTERRMQFKKFFRGYAGNVGPKRTFVNGYKAPESVGTDANGKSSRQGLIHKTLYRKLSKGGLDAGSPSGLAMLHGKTVSNGYRTGFKKKLSGSPTIDPAEASRYIEKLLHSIEEKYSKQTPEVVESRRRERHPALPLHIIAPRQDGRKMLVKLMLATFIALCILLIIAALTWICQRHRSLPIRLFGRYGKSSNHGEYKRLSTEDEDIFKRKKLGSKDTNERNSMKDNFKIPKLVKEPVSSQEGNRNSGSVTSLTGAGEQPNSKGDLPASMQTLLPIFMGRYNAFQSSGEDSRLPLGLRSGTESDTSSTSEIYRTWSSQVVKNVLKGISDKLSKRSSRESQNEMSLEQSDGMMQNELNGCPEKNLSAQQIHFQTPTKLEAASQNIERNLKDDALNLSSANPHEFCENGRRCSTETFHDNDGIFQRQKQLDNSNVMKSSVDVESGYTEKPRERRRKKRRRQMPPSNRESLYPEHNLQCESSESDNKFDEAKSNGFNSIETKPLVHKSRESDYELSPITQGINGSGTGKSSSSALSDHGECTKDHSISRTVQMGLKQAEGRSSLQPLTSAQAKRQVQEFDAFKELLAMNAESSPSDVCGVRATRKEELRNICNPSFGSWTGKSYAKRSYTRRSNRVPFRKSKKPRSLSSSSIGKSDDPEFCKSIWTAMEFVIGDRGYDNVSNCSSNPIRSAITPQPDVDLQHVTLDFCKKNGDRQLGHMQKSAANQGVTESIVQRSDLRKEGPISFDLVAADNHERPILKNTTESAYKYIYYDPGDLVLGRAFPGSASDGRRDCKGAKKKQDDLWHNTRRDSQQIKESVLDSGINSSSRSTTSLLSHISSKCSPRGQFHLMDSNVSSDKGIQTAKKRRKKWKFMKRIFQSKKSVMKSYSEDGLVRERRRKKNNSGDLVENTS